MVKQRGKGSKQPGRGDSSRGGKQRLVKLTPQARQNIKKMRKAIKAADRACDQSGSEYVPSQDISSDSVPTHFHSSFRLTDDTPPPSPTAQAPGHVSTESSEGSAAGSGEYSTSPTASLSGEGADGGKKEVQGDEEVAEGGEPQVGGIARTRKPEVWEDRFVIQVAYHKFREWWPVRKLIPERSFIDRDLLPHNPDVHRQFRTRVGWEHF